MRYRGKVNVEFIKHGKEDTIFYKAVMNLPNV